MDLFVGLGGRRFLKVSLMKPSIEISEMFVTLLSTQTAEQSITKHSCTCSLDEL